MLHRSYSFLNFIRHSVSHQSDQLLIFQVCNSKQKASILVTSKFIHVLSNSRKLCNSLNTSSIRQLKIGVQNALRFSTKNSNAEVTKISKVTQQFQKTPESSELVDDSSSKTASAKKIRVDTDNESLDKNFITQKRALTDFPLKSKDLESLPKTKRRSPFDYDPPVIEYWRKDVEAKALDIWGSRDALLKELLKTELERKIHEQNLFTVKKRMRDYRKEEISKHDERINEGLFGRSGKVILTAVVANLFNFFCKLVACISTGSHSMFSECVHSAADTLNQLILAYGIQKSVQNPNPDHPYGYTNMQYVTALASGVGILCVGAGLSIYHGCHGLIFPGDLKSFYWAYVTLAVSFVSDSFSLRNAFISTNKAALEKGKTLKEYVLSGQDPSVNVVLMEDFAAVLGVLCAASCMGLTSYLGNPVYDAIGSLLVGGVLGGVAIFIIRTNSAALVGRSIPQEALEKMNTVLENDIMVRTIHDVKGIDMGNSVVRYKAELYFDGRELTKTYLEKHDLNKMLEEVKQMERSEQLENFLLNHGESIVGMLGGEIDRIELKLKKKHPEIRHCDLEIS